MFATRAAHPLRSVGRIQAAAATRAMILKTRVAVPTGTRILSTSQAPQEEYKTSPLIQQRKNRPLSPHLTIYQPQLTWYLSMFHRATGGAVAVGFYAGAIAYAVAPMMGMGFDAATVTSTVAALPVAAKIGGKLLISYPATFHFYNGIRHLIWDTTAFMTIKGVYQTGWAVVGLTTVTSLALSTMF